MARDPRQARLLGLWTAGWLAVLLLVGVLWLGDLSLQWPVFVIPLVWALVALRPRRRDDDEDDDWEPIPPPDRSWRQDLGHRTDTVERPTLGTRDTDERY